MLLVHNALDILDHDDRVFDEDADREHHAEQGEHVDRETEHPEAKARARQRDRHDHGRNHRRAPILEKQEHDEEEHTSELQSLMRKSYAVFCLKKKKKRINRRNYNTKRKQTSDTHEESLEKYT